MAILMQGKGDGPTIHFRRIQLTGLYLKSARKAAAASLALSPTDDNIDDRIELGILTVMWSTLALEAGANQFAEDVFPIHKANDFDKCKKEFHKPPQISRVIWKWKHLFSEGPKKPIDLSEPIFIDAERLIQLRHRLSHYQPQDASQKLYYQPTEPVKQPDGSFSREMWNASMRPFKIEPSLIEQELVANKSRENFHAARNMFTLWERAYSRDEKALDVAIPRL